ncbi:MAG: LytTR family DNA-binding domain-containing protein [Pseudomonadota bacterium]
MPTRNRTTGFSKQQARITRDLAIHYAAAPLITAILFGVNRVGFAREVSLPQGILYWLGIGLIVWITLDLTTRLVRVVWPSLEAGGLSQLVLGAVLGVAFVTFPLSTYMESFVSQLAPGHSYRNDIRIDRIVRNPLDVLKFAGLPIYWVLANLFTKIILRTNPYASTLPWKSDQERKAGVQAPAAQKLLERLPEALRAPLIFIQAADHHVCVRTEEGEALIRARFSDAVKDAQLSQEGVQIHRSIWVAEDAIETVFKDQRRWLLKLHDGKIFPISRSAEGLLRAKGFI